MKPMKQLRDTQRRKVYAAETQVIHSCRSMLAWYDSYDSIDGFLLRIRFDDWFQKNYPLVHGIACHRKRSRRIAKGWANRYQGTWSVHISIPLHEGCYLNNSLVVLHEIAHGLTAINAYEQGIPFAGHGPEWVDNELRLVSHFIPDIYPFLKSTYEGAGIVHRFIREGYRRGGKQLL